MNKKKDEFTEPPARRSAQVGKNTVVRRCLLTNERKTSTRLDAQAHERISLKQLADHVKPDQSDTPAMAGRPRPAEKIHETAASAREPEFQGENTVARAPDKSSSYLRRQE
jgi:hypothetical protein